MPKIRKPTIFFVLLLLTMVAGVVWKRIPALSKESGSIEVIGGSIANLQLPIRHHFSQKDPRWSHHKLGATQETLRQSGCTLSCVAMSLRYRGYSYTPATLNRTLRKAQGFTKRGWLIWGRIPLLTQKQWHPIVPRFPSHEDLERQLQQGNPVIAKVRWMGWFTHWILIVGKRNHEYLALDPWDHKRTLRPLSYYRSKIHSIRWLQRTRTNHSQREFGIRDVAPR